MNSSTHNEPMPTKELSPEFNSWEMNGPQFQIATDIRSKFDDLLKFVESQTPAYNARYLALAKTKLEEACLFAVKGIAKPQ